MWSYALIDASKIVAYGSMRRSGRLLLHNRAMLCGA